VASCFFHCKDLAELNFWGDTEREPSSQPAVSNRLARLSNDLMMMVFRASDERDLAQLSQASKKQRADVESYCVRQFKLYQSIENTCIEMTCIFPQGFRDDIAAMRSIIQKVHVIRGHLNGRKPLLAFFVHEPIEVGNPKYCLAKYKNEFLEEFFLEHQYGYQSNSNRMNILTWLAHRAIGHYTFFDEFSAEPDQAFKALITAIKLGANVNRQRHNRYLTISGDPLYLIWKLVGKSGWIRTDDPKYARYKMVVDLLVKNGGWNWIGDRKKILQHLRIKDGLYDVAPAGAAAATAVSTIDQKS